MKFSAGNRVTHPSESGKEGIILAVRRNPACLMRSVEIRWDDGSDEEIEEIAWGPLED